MISFLDLPLEVRNKVYKLHFVTTTLTSNGDATRNMDKNVAKLNQSPAGKQSSCLAITKSCKQVYEETKAMWVQLVTFRFNSNRNLLEGMTPLTAEVRGSIRHLYLEPRFVKPSLRYLQPGRAGLQAVELDPPKMLLSDVLGLIAGLELDVLTIDMRGIKPYPLEESTLIGDLTASSGGWKTLHFRPSSSVILGLLAMHNVVLGVAESHMWHRNLLKRDGHKSGASVKTYRAKQANISEGAIFDDSHREEFSERPEDWRNKAKFDGFTPTSYLEGDPEREVLIVAKRGHSADIRSKPVEMLDLRKGLVDTYNDVSFWEKPITWETIKQGEKFFDQVQDHRDGMDSNVEYEEVLKDMRDGADATDESCF